MPALQIKDCPQPVYDALKFSAAEDDRSMAQQALHIIKAYLAARDNHSADDVAVNNMTACCAKTKKQQAIASISQLAPGKLPKGYSSPTDVVLASKQDVVNRGGVILA
jgi:plasmid stability protein